MRRIIPAYAGSTRDREGFLAAIRIIPAYAGSTVQSHLLRSVCEDHPRLRGEHGEVMPLAMPVAGSSPPTRGAHAVLRFGSSHLRIIPAYAGSTSPTSFQRILVRDHPRLRGEHASTCTTESRRAGSSPPTRGARARHHRS